MPIPTAVSIAVTVVTGVIQLERDHQQDMSTENLQRLAQRINEHLSDIFTKLKKDIAQSYIDQDINDIASKLDNAGTKLLSAGTAPCYDTGQYYHDIVSIADDGFGYIPRLLGDITTHEADLRDCEGAVVAAIVYARTLLSVMRTASERQDISDSTPDFHKKYRDDQTKAYQEHVSHALSFLRMHFDKTIKFGEEQGELGPSGRSVNVGYYIGGKFDVIEEVQRGPGFEEKLRGAKDRVKKLIEDMKKNNSTVKAVRELSSV
jgi:hypothetical protein